MSKLSYESIIKRAKTNADCGEHLSPAEVTELVLAFETQVKQLAEANQQLRDENLKSTSALYDVVAENAALKSAIEFSEPWLPSCDDELLHRIKAVKETPATDAAIASLRAEGVELLLEWLPPYYTARADIENYIAHLRSQSEQVKGVQS